MFSQLYKAIKLFCSALGALSQTQMTDFATLSYTSTSKIPILSHTWSLKKVLLSGGASLIGHLYSPPPLLEGISFILLRKLGKNKVRAFSQSSTSILMNFLPEPQTINIANVTALLHVVNR